MLTSKCNGSCDWCIDRDGYHPKEHASWLDLARKIISTGKYNIILLGGEPTLYPELGLLINYLKNKHRKVYLTTNGSKLNSNFIFNNKFLTLAGINISIHHYSLEKNSSITGIQLNYPTLQDAIQLLRAWGINVRLNCNIIKGHVDSQNRCLQYIDFAKGLRATSVRFAELKSDQEHFISLAKLFNNQYGLNEDPFQLGCNNNTKINGMAVNFRQMCGFQIAHRPQPDKPEPAQDKQVLYYDGHLYNGWQAKETGMKTKKLRQLLKKVAAGQLSVEDALAEIQDNKDAAYQTLAQKLEKVEQQVDRIDTGGFCQY